MKEATRGMIMSDATAKENSEMTMRRDGRRVSVIPGPSAIESGEPERINKYADVTQSVIMRAMMQVEDRMHKSSRRS